MWNSYENKNYGDAELGNPAKLCVFLTSFYIKQSRILNFVGS